MTTGPSTKTETIALIERVRRAMPLNRDVMALADLLERAVVSTQRNVVTTIEPVVSTKCAGELCVRRRAAKSRSMQRWRKARKPSIMDEPVA